MRQSCLTLLLLVLLAAASWGQSVPYPASTYSATITNVPALRSCVGSDLWPMTWGADGNLYTAYGDGEGCVAGGDTYYGMSQWAGTLPTTPLTMTDIFTGVIRPGAGYDSIDNKKFVSLQTDGTNFYGIWTTGLDRYDGARGAVSTDSGVTWNFNPTTPILDNFNRTDGPPPAGWTVLGGPGFTTNGSGLIPNAGAASGIGWPTLFGADQEMSFKMTALIEEPRLVELQVRMNVVTGDYYCADFIRVAAANDQIKICYRTVADDFHYVKTIDLGDNFAAGDVIGMSVVGDTVTVYVNGVAKGSQTMSNKITSAGYVAVNSDKSSTLILDDFRAGAPQVITSLARDNLGLGPFIQVGKGYTGVPVSMDSSKLYMYLGSGTSGASYLVRAPLATPFDRNTYEYLSAIDGSNNAIWSSNPSSKIAVFTNDDLRGDIWGDVTYNAGIGRFIHVLKTGDARVRFYEATTPWGPWNLMHDEAVLVDSTVKLNPVIPSKFISGDGLTMWLVFSGTGSYDSANFAQITLALRRHQP
jgi:hypothetical protein